MELPEEIYNSIFRIYTEVHLKRDFSGKSRDDIVEDEDINKMIPMKRAELLTGAEVFAMKCKEQFEKMPRFYID